MSVQRPDQYEWWIDMIQDCLCQVAGQFDKINPGGGMCHHVCDETYIDLETHVEMVVSNGFCDVPPKTWMLIVELSESNELEVDVAMKIASQCLSDEFFAGRERWTYGHRG